MKKKNAIGEQFNLQRIGVNHVQQLETPGPNPESAGMLLRISPMCHVCKDNGKVECGGVITKDLHHNYLSETQETVVGNSSKLPLCVVTCQNSKACIVSV